MNDTLIIVLSHSKQRQKVAYKNMQSYMSEDVSKNIDCNSEKLKTTKMYK